MVQLSKIVNTTLISQIGLYLNLVFQVRSAILTRKAHENLLHQNLLVFLLRKKLIRKKLKLLQQRQSTTKPRKCWYQLGRSDQWWQDMINGVSPEDWWNKHFRFSREKFFSLVNLLKTTIDRTQFKYS